MSGKEEREREGEATVSAMKWNPVCGFRCLTPINTTRRGKKKKGAKLR